MITPSPVTSFREKFRDKRVQVTLNQMLGGEDADDGDFECKPGWKRPKFTKSADSQETETDEDGEEEEPEEEVVEATIVVYHQKKLQS